jgi:hypothetical protein
MNLPPFVAEWILQYSNDLLLLLGSGKFCFILFWGATWNLDLFDLISLRWNFQSTFCPHASQAQNVRQCMYGNVDDGNVRQAAPASKL